MILFKGLKFFRVRIIQFKIAKALLPVLRLFDTFHHKWGVKRCFWSSKCSRAWSTETQRKKI